MTKLSGVFADLALALVAAAEDCDGLVACFFWEHLKNRQNIRTPLKMCKNSTLFVYISLILPNSLVCGEVKSKLEMRSYKVTGQPL
jgi:hypothetical protein